MLDTGGVMCIICGKVLKSIENGKRHVRETHHPNQKAQCGICKKLYKNERQRNDHCKAVHGVTAKEMQNLIMVSPKITTNYKEDTDDQYYQ